MSARTADLVHDVTAPASFAWDPVGNLRLTGAFQLVSSGRRVALPHSVERVLACLALAEGPVKRSTLAGRLWADTPQSRAANNLRTALWRLQAVHTDLIGHTDGRCRLAAGVGVDVHRVTTAALHLIRNPHDDGALAELPLLLGSDDLLPDWDDEWVVADRERLRLLRLESLERAAEALLDRGAALDAQLAARAAVDIEPLRESSCRLLVRACAARGNLAEAIAFHARFRDLLWAEFRVRPTAAMGRLMAAVRQEQPDRPPAGGAV